MKSTRWTDDDTCRLVYLREVARWPWSRIRSEFPGRSQTSCKVRYWYVRLPDRGTRFAPKRKKLSQVKPQQAPASPRTKAPMSHNALLIDAELRARVEIQGITGGLLGDPLPGRSALDQHRSRELA